MAAIAQTVSTFYHELGGLIARKCNKAEFEYDLDYLLRTSPRIEGLPKPLLRSLAVDAFDDAEAAGVEIKKYVNQRARAAKAVAKSGSRDLPGAKQKLGPLLNKAVKAGGNDYHVGDAVEAMMLHNGVPVLEHVLGQYDGELPGLPTGQDPALTPDLAAFLEALKGNDVPALQDLATAMVPRPNDEKWMAWMKRRAGEISTTAEAYYTRFKEDPTAVIKELGHGIADAYSRTPPEALLVMHTVLSLALLTQGVVQVDSLAEAAGALGSMGAGWFIADLVTAPYHIENDAFGDNPTAHAFKRHHDHPAEITGWDLRRNVARLGLAVVPVLLLTVAAQPHFAIGLGALVFLQGAMFTQEIHKYAHTPERKLPKLKIGKLEIPWVKWLQDAHIFLGRKEHLGGHHKSLNSNYGVVNGWSNKLLDSIGFPRWYESMRKKMGAAEPDWIRQLDARKQKVQRNLAAAAAKTAASTSS